MDEFLKLMQSLECDDRYEEVLYTWQKEGRKEGLRMSEVLDRIEQRGEKRGERRGREEMANEISQLITILLEQNRIEDLKRTASDRDYQDQLMIEYGIGEGDE